MYKAVYKYFKMWIFKFLKFFFIHSFSELETGKTTSNYIEKPELIMAKFRENGNTSRFILLYKIFCNSIFSDKLFLDFVTNLQIDEYAGKQLYLIFKTII